MCSHMASLEGAHTTKNLLLQTVKQFLDSKMDKERFHYIFGASKK